MLQILANTVGAKARYVDDDGAAATGYEPRHLLTGPRSRLYRTTEDTDSSVAYVCDETVSATHLVIARADYLLTNNGGTDAGTEINVYKHAGYGGSSAAAVGSAQVIDAPGDLIGHNAQDWVYSFGSTHSGYGFSVMQFGNPSSSTSHVFQCSKLYFSEAFDFGVNPQPGALTWEFLDPGALQLYRPLEGTFEYAIEARITMALPTVAGSVLDAFAEIPTIYRWPFFLYDSTGAVIPWKLEHVILERFEQRILGDDTWAATLTFLRLKHYP